MPPPVSETVVDAASAAAVAKVAVLDLTESISGCLIFYFEF